MRTFVAALLLAYTLFAHPMGNFSVSHYARIEVAPGTSHLLYVLDLAEIPTFELFQQWKINGRNQSEVDSQAAVQAVEWVRNLKITSEGQDVRPDIQQVISKVVDGAGNLPVLRVEVHADLKMRPGVVSYEDFNYAGRAGWKEVVIKAVGGATISQTTQPA